MTRATLVKTWEPVECACSEEEQVVPDGFTRRHRAAPLFCYTQKHDPLFMAVWEAIKGWDIQRSPGDGYAHATGDDVCTILEALGRVFLGGDARDKDDD